ncbi:MAG TPA: hypothetical protein PLK19_15915 [Mycobacterium sp.]|nr:hypothetical protein [Mycobacterium sp.]
MAENLSNDALRSQVRMQVAFWKAKDRRSITTGPAWLWRGPFTGPRRITDLDSPTAQKLTRRQGAGMGAADLYSTAGPRRLRLPRAVSAVRAAAWITAAVSAAIVAVQIRAEHPRAAAVLFAIAVAGALIGSATAVLEIWARRDPLRLSPAEAAEVAASRREITWNPLAGTGTLSDGGAYMLEALDTCTQLRDHPAWALPGTEALRWQIDLGEETFQIARAAAALDHYVTATPADDDSMTQQSHRQLTAALLERLVALHRCLRTLSALSRAAIGPVGDNDQVIRETLTAAVENELATGEWNELTADLLAHIDGYAVIAEVKTSTR